MSESTKLTQEEEYVTWVTEVRENKNGRVCADNLKKFGSLWGNRYSENFFEYRDYEEFKPIYQEITEESDEKIIEILKDKKTQYSQKFIKQCQTKTKTPHTHLGGYLRSYLKFLDYQKRPGFGYPDKRKKIDDEIELDDGIDESYINKIEFKTWLSIQITDKGQTLDDKTIVSKINALKDIEAYFKISIFGETDIEVLQQLKDQVLSAKHYNRYLGVPKSAFDYYIRFIESKPIVRKNENYETKDFLSEVFINEKEFSTLASVLKNKKNLILKGAPGVGKTFIAERLAYVMMKEKDNSRMQMIQFHQSYSYEDFIEGYRPKVDGDGFELKQGPFVKFARMAERDPKRDYFFIIDEINRGNMSKIFGELMMLIETDKRGKSVKLLYSNEHFSVPENLYIIGMMNTADRSLALLDYALRRRFAFIDIHPAFENPTFKKEIEGVNPSDRLLRVIEEIKRLNIRIEEELGAGFKIGHSYFLDNTFHINADERVAEVVEYEIIPQLYEYWFDDEQKALGWAERLRACCDEN